MAKWVALVSIGGALVFVLYRRRRLLGQRLRLALWVALVGYAGLFIVRVAQEPPDRDQLTALAGVLVAFGLIWLALWLFATRRHRVR